MSISSSHEKEPLLCLHGALGHQESLKFLGPLLEGPFQLHFPSFEGHGSPYSPDRPFRMENFVQNILDYLDEHGIKKASLFGYSMGGYVALQLALDHGERINRIMTLGTKFFWTEEAALKETRFLDVEKLLLKAPQLVQVLARAHGEKYWKILLKKTAELLLHLGSHDLLTPERLKQISLPVRITVGDRDAMSGLEASLKAYQALNQAEFCVLPATPHQLEAVRPELLAQVMGDFFKCTSPRP